MTFLQCLDDGTALFELTEGRGVEPHPFFSRPFDGLRDLGSFRFLSLSKDRFILDRALRPFDMLKAQGPLFSSPFDPLHRLGMAKEGGKANAEGIEKDSYGIEDSHVFLTLNQRP